jgi:hypothetical protein
MPTASALGLVLVGGAFVLSRFEQHYLASIVLASIAGAIAAFALLGWRPWPPRRRCSKAISPRSSGRRKLRLPHAGAA